MNIQINENENGNRQVAYLKPGESCAQIQINGASVKKWLQKLNPFKKK